MYTIRLVDRPSLLVSGGDALHHAMRAWVGYIEYRFPDGIGDRKWWVALDEKDWWVGFAGLQIFDEAKGVVLLNPCEVKPEARGQRLQQRFIAEREKWAVQNGFRVSISLTNYDNIISANNLIKFGYKLRLPWPGAAGLGLYWTKELNVKNLQEMPASEGA